MRSWTQDLYSLYDDISKMFQKYFENQKMANTEQSPPPHSITLREVRLCAVLAIFDFRNIFETFSKYHHIDPKSPGNRSFRKSNKIV